MRRPLLLLVPLALLHGLLYAALTPPWQAPDEIAHFEYAHLLARYRRPLTRADASPDLERQLIGSLYTFQAWRYVHQQPPSEVPVGLDQAPFFGRSRTLSRFSLAYVPYALAAWPFLGQDVVVQLYAMRGVSVLIGALVVVLAFQTARLVEPEMPALALGASLFVLLLPQHAYILATVNDGNLAELLASAALYQLVRMLRAGPSWRRAALAALSGTLAVLTKATAYFLIPLAIIVGLAFVLRWLLDARLRPGWAQRRPVLLAALALGALLLPAVPLAFLPAVSGQPMAMLGSVLDSLARPEGYPAYLLGLAAGGQLWRSVWWTFASFWGTFGWMAAPLPAPWYLLILAAVALSGLGWARRLRRRRTAARPHSIYAVLGLAAILPVAVLFGWFVLSSIGLYGYQGRYLYGGIVLIALLLVQGWLSLASGRRAGSVLALVVAGLVLLDASALLLVLVPFFYG